MRFISCSLLVEIVSCISSQHVTTQFCCNACLIKDNFCGNECNSGGIQSSLRAVFVCVCVFAVV